jgi:hypothetical protein
MSGAVSLFVKMALNAGALLLIANEIRGFVLAAPVLYGLYAAGGTLAALWIAFSSLAGIALSIIVPVVAAKKLKQHQLSRVR